MLRLAISLSQDVRVPPTRSVGYCALFAIALFATSSHAFSATTACSAAWSASEIYTGGQAASYQNINYTANWWTEGQTPSTNSGGPGSGQPWTSTGVCGTSSNPPSNPAPGSCSTAWSASTIYTGGQTVTYQNVNYTANWWTQGQIPSSNSGGPGSGQPWTPTGTCGGSSSNPPPSPPPPASPEPPAAGTRYFAPYVDMGLTSDEEINAIQQQAGLKAVTLAFLVSGSGSCTATWGGLGGNFPQDTLGDGQSMQTVIQSLQTSGAQVIISFGGENGEEPAYYCTNVSQLQALYQSVINRYHVLMLDFDIEGAAVTDQPSITRRDQALKALKAANPGLVVSYTLPVLPTGLVSTGVNVLKSVKSDGLALDLVNVMAMDYGTAVDNGGQMALDATQAAINTENQIAAAGLTGTTIGITPMIGVNDTNTEIFKLADAQTLLTFAESNSYVTRLAMWSLARDNGSCAGAAWASATCSGLAQSTYAFSQIFSQVQ